MPRRRSGKKIDFTHWEAGQAFTAAFGAGTVALNLFSAQHLPEIILRMRGEYFTTIDGVQSPGVSAKIGCGIILVPEGTGTTVLWSPITDADAPWMWIDYSFIIYEESVVDVIPYPVGLAVRKVIDSKAMRIVKNMEIQVVWENVTAQGAVNVLSSVMVRALAGT